MKHKNIFILLLGTILLSSCIKNNETLIYLNIRGEKPKEIIYTIPYDGLFNSSFNDTIKIDSLGKYEIKIPTKATSFMLLRIPDFMGNQRLVVEPGEKIEIYIDVKADYNSSMKINSKNKKGLDLYLTLPYDYLEMEIIQFKNDTSLSVTKERILELKKNDISRFKSLLDSGSVSHSFYDLIVSDRDCYYASLEIVNSMIKLIQSDSIDHLSKINISDIYKANSPEDENLMTSSYWYDYVNSYVLFHLIDVRNQFNESNMHALIIEEAKKVLKGKSLEAYEAHYLAESFRNERREKQLISLFENFKKDFPNSNYIKYIEPDINKVIQYHEIIEQPFKETMEFVENYENLNSLKDVIATQKGRKLYIDIWATWCGPCKRESVHNPELKKLLKSQNTDIIYISIDRKEADEIWRSMIKYYNLEGKHIRANKDLYLDIHNQYGQGGSIYIPWYIQIDENGVVTEWHAKSPSELVNENK